MNFKVTNSKHNLNSSAHQFSVSPTAYRQWRDVMLVGMCFLLTLLASEVRGQTPSSIPPLTSATSVPQTAPPPDAELAPQSNVATTQEQQPEGQQLSDDQSSGFVFKTQVREVILHAIVVDEQRQLVTDLDRPAFTAFENGVPQATTSFHREDVPVAMGIVIDNSGSMREKRDKVNQSVLNLIRAGKSTDETFVVNFSQDSYLDQDFTSDIDLLRGALQKVTARGSTALYDAIVASAVHLQNDNRVQRKILLVITDGRDNASLNTTGRHASLAAGEWA